MKHKNIKLRIICLFLFFFSIKEVINAQNKIDGYTVNPKFGAYFAEYVGIIGGVEINLTSNNYILSFDYLRTFQIMGRERLHQMDIMIGKYIGEKIFRFQFQGGLGMLSGTKVNEARRITEDISTIGIPLKIGFKLLVTRFLSIGVDLQSHINSKQSIYMPMFSIEIGKIKK